MWRHLICQIIPASLYFKDLKKAAKTKRMKYLGVNLTKQVKDLYNENYKAFLKEMDDDIKRWKDIPSHSFKEVNTLLKIGCVCVLKSLNNSKNTHYMFLSLITSFFCNINWDFCVDNSHIYFYWCTDHSPKVSPKFPTAHCHLSLASHPNTTLSRLTAELATFPSRSAFLS